MDGIVVWYLSLRAMKRGLGLNIDEATLNAY